MFSSSFAGLARGGGIIILIMNTSLQPCLHSLRPIMSRAPCGSYDHRAHTCWPQPACERCARCAPSRCVIGFSLLLWSLWAHQHQQPRPHVHSVVPIHARSRFTRSAHNQHTNQTYTHVPAARSLPVRGVPGVPPAAASWAWHALPGPARTNTNNPSHMPTADEVPIHAFSRFTPSPHNQRINQTDTHVPAVRSLPVRGVPGEPPAAESWAWHALPGPE
jgi:hypothetical protein